MYLGVFTMLLGELLFFNNKNLLLYLLFFMVAQSINVPLHEERVLRKSFGPKFEEYCKHVPRWIPRLHPYTPARVRPKKLALTFWCLSALTDC